MEKLPQLQCRNGRVSRRDWMTVAASMLCSAPVFAQRGAAAPPRSNSLLFYVGTYSSPQGPEGSKGRGSGIYLCEMDAKTGALTQRQMFPSGNNPSWAAFHPQHTHLYTANETPTFNGSKAGSVSSYAMDAKTGHLTLLNTVSSEGAGPCHLSVHPNGKHVFVANYAGGTVGVLPIQPDGSLGAASDIKKNEGTLGPEKAASAPPGSFAISGHDHPHAHMVEADPSGKFVIAADLGLDQLLIWKYDEATGKLTPNNPPHATVPAGDGPRHFIFHPNGKWFYSLQEEGSTLILFDWDASTGTLKQRQSLSTLPKGFAGTNFTSEIRISPDARFVYIANRLHDTIAWFPIGADGTLSWGGEEWTRGDYPRSFTIDPTGNFLFSCNQRSDAITTFRVNKKTGALTFTGSYTPVGTPAIVLFL